jgi:hypothetical protein
MEFKIIQIRGQVIFNGEIISKIQNRIGAFKNRLMNQKARKAQIYTKTS